MTIIYILFIVIALLLLFDFKKGVLLYAPLKLFFNINVRFGAFTFDLAMSVLILILFLFKRKKLKQSTFPLKKYFILYALGYTLTCLYPDFSINMMPRIVIMVLGFSYVYYYCIQNNSDIRFALSSYAIFAIIMCVNGLLQPLFGINPLDDFLKEVSDKDNSFFIDNEWIRMGQVRYRSFIPHAISYGVASCIILYLFIWKYLMLNNKSKRLTIITIGMLFSAIIICGSRTPFLGLMPLILIIFNKQYIGIKMRRKLIFLIFAFIIIKGDYIFYSINSLIDSSTVDDAGGSSMQLRIHQFTIALNWMLENPLFGKGMHFDAFNTNSEILGSESVWMPLMFQNGLVGVISYAIIYWGCYKIFKKSPGKLFLLIFSLGWLIMRTATSLIGVTDVQFFTCMFIIYRYYEFNNNISLIKNVTLSNNTSL